MESRLSTHALRKMQKAVFGRWYGSLFLIFRNFYFDRGKNCHFGGVFLPLLRVNLLSFMLSFMLQNIPFEENHNKTFLNSLSVLTLYSKQPLTVLFPWLLHPFFKWWLLCNHIKCILKTHSGM